MRENTRGVDRKGREAERKEQKMAEGEYKQEEGDDRAKKRANNHYIHHTCNYLDVN